VKRDGLWRRERRKEKGECQKEEGRRKKEEGRILRDDNMGKSGFKNEDMIMR
jgi:hypothetical protein